jgi:hypothetical protein
VKFSVFATLAALAVAQPASAAIIVTHWSGVLYSGSDPTDVFGTGNPDLAGVAYDVVSTLDTEKGLYATYPWGDDLRADIYGSHQLLGVATLTINGHSLVFGASNSDLIPTRIVAYNNNYVGKTVIQGTFFDGEGNGAPCNDLEIKAFGYDGYNPASIFTPIPEGFCLAATACGGSFRFDASRGNPGVVYGEFGGTFSLPVPEPTTWAMMILGFGLMGGALRRRRNPEVSL